MRAALATVVDQPHTYHSTTWSQFSTLSLEYTLVQKVITLHCTLFDLESREITGYIYKLLEKEICTRQR